MISAGISCLAAISTAGVKYYRGFSGGNPQESFWTSTKQGFRGGVEFAVMSCTPDPDVALLYANKDPSSSIMFEFQPSTLCRPASTQDFSLYPQFKEFVFPPLTFLEVTRDRVQVFGGHSVLVLEVQPFYRV